MYKIKNYYKEWYQPHESFVVRNPLFPVENFYHWIVQSEAGSASAGNELRQQMHDFYLQPLVQEALYIGSPDLHEQLMLWLDNKIDKTDKREKMELSLAKYMIRMCTRCTPYGLFASCTNGTFADHTSIKSQNKAALKRFGRLDMDYVGQVLTHLLNKKEINDQLKFYPNTSLYPMGDNYRYIEHRFTKETGRSYHLVQIARSEYLTKILLAAENGCLPSDLASQITDEEISSEEANAFIQELIINQVLISDLEPNVTGEEYFSILVNKLKSLKYTERYVNCFEKVMKEFNEIKSDSGISKNKFYLNIVSHLQELEIPVHLKTLIQVDSYRPAENCLLNKKVAEDVLYGASLLHLLTMGDEDRDSFSDFKNAFIGRFESQWIPLVEVLDTEAGIGYGKFATSGMEESPLIDKLPIGNGMAGNSMKQMSDAETFKWNLYQEAILQNKNEVVIDDATVEEASKKEISSKGLPDSVYNMVKINAKSAADIDAGNYQISMYAPSGPSGGNLFGRFCHLHPEIEKLTRKILQQEEAHAPDCIFAEIVHLPESRIGNILMRPVLRDYEIPYLCGTTLDKQFQIPVTDLLVGIEGNTVVLRSIRLNKQVIPRMTTAHNFSMTTLPVYQFLCDLQYQNVRPFGWSWGILDTRPFLPRVSYGKYILSKARWIISKDEIREMDKKEDQELVVKFSELAKKRNLPRYILLSQGDNELLLDLQNIFCIKLLLPEINKNQTVTLIETLDLPDQCWIESPDGHHTGEFLFSFNKNITAAVGAKPISTVKAELTVQRYFPVGSEWLFAKIYCGTKTAEKLLSETLKDLTEELISEKIIDKYFFIRYSDTGSHIRIRFHNSTTDGFWKTVIERLQKLLMPYINNHSVYNLQFETYQREIERYGSDTMVLSEDLFFYHSAAIVNFISMLSGDEGEQYRWQVTLKALDFFLDDFGYTTIEKRDLLKVLSESFSNEFSISGPQQKKISERFSNSKKMIQQLMNNVWEDNEDMKTAIDVFRIDNENYRKTIEAILNAPSIQHDIEQLNHLMPSYMHMFINRMFVSNQRKVELVIYDYLFKIYETRVAMEKNQKVKNKVSEVRS